MVSWTPRWQRQQTAFVAVHNESWNLPYARELVDKIQSEFGESASLPGNYDYIGRGALAGPVLMHEEVHLHAQRGSFGIGLTHAALEGETVTRCFRIGPGGRRD